jgi:hypothetical protein
MTKKHIKMLTILGHRRNANQNHTKIPFSLLLEWLPSRTQRTANAGEDAGENEPSHTAGVMLASTTTMENSMEAP